MTTHIAMERPFAGRIIKINKEGCDKDGRYKIVTIQNEMNSKQEEIMLCESTVRFEIQTLPLFLLAYVFPPCLSFPIRL